MILTIEQYHKIENELEVRLKKLNPNHPALKCIYCSTHAAIESYREALTPTRISRGDE